MTWFLMAEREEEAEESKPCYIIILLFYTYGVAVTMIISHLSISAEHTVPVPFLSLLLLAPVAPCRRKKPKQVSAE